MSAMVVHVRLFASLRERAGTDSLELELWRGATVADALRTLAKDDSLGELLERMPVHMAVNRDYAASGTVLAPEDELALIPPVSGGAPSTEGVENVPIHVRVSEEPLSLQALSAAVGDPGAGAIVIFQGVTREVERLDYEAYTAMAEERIEAIMRECVVAHDLRAAAVEHRVGSVPLGEPSVIVAVSAAHRAEAFAGAREAIDRLKAEAPIWKREHAAGMPGRWAPGIEPTQ
jgi:molybdopterin converting factor subunit 1